MPRQIIILLEIYANFACQFRRSERARSTGTVQSLYAYILQSLLIICMPPPPPPSCQCELGHTAFTPIFISSYILINLQSHWNVTHADCMHAGCRHQCFRTNCARMCVCVCARNVTSSRAHTQIEMKLWGKLWKQLINSWIASSASTVNGSSKCLYYLCTVDSRLPHPKFISNSFLSLREFPVTHLRVAERLRKMSTRCKVVSTSFHAIVHSLFTTFNREQWTQASGIPGDYYLIFTALPLHLVQPAMHTPVWGPMNHPANSILSHCLQSVAGRPLDDFAFAPAVLNFRTYLHNYVIFPPFLVMR